MLFFLVAVEFISKPIRPIQKNRRVNTCGRATTQHDTPLGAFLGQFGHQSANVIRISCESHNPANFRRGNFIDRRW